MYDYRRHKIEVEQMGLNFQAIIWRAPYHEGDMPRHITQLVATEERANRLARKWIDRKAARGEW